MPDLPQTAREVHLAAHAEGALTGDEFRLVDRPLSPPGPGRVLVRNEYLGIAAVVRELMQERSTVPMGQFELGRPLTGATVGTVVATGDGVDGVEAGDLVSVYGPWADVTDAGADAVTVLDRDALPEPFYHLAAGNGATALRGVRDVAGVGEGDVVLVSGAAGGVGALAGQIARRLGAARVIGTAGSPEKCRWLVEELGFDAAFDHHDDDLAGTLRRAAPDGIDVYVDLAGGHQFEAAVEVAADHARFAVGGALAAQQAGAPWPRLDTQTALVKGLTIRGYALIHSPQIVAEWPALFARWLADGLVYPHTVVDGGIDAAPRAMVDLIAGRYTGNVAIRLSAAAWP